MMRLSDGRQRPRNLLCLFGLMLGAHRLSSHYYTSAAFEHPIPFSVTTLLIASIAFLCRSAACLVSDRPTHPLRVLRSAPTADASSPSLVFRGLELLRRTRPQFVVLVACLALRTLLFWYTLRASQCAWHGAEALLPALVVLVHYLTPVPTTRLLPGVAKPETPQSSPTPASTPSYSLVGYAVLSAAWAGSVKLALDASTIRTGAVCPTGLRLWGLTPLLQLVMCGLDAVVVVYTSRVSRLESDRGHDVSPFLASACAAAAALAGLVASLPFIVESEKLALVSVGLPEMRHILLDASLAAIVVLCAASLADVVQPWTLSVVGVGLGLVGFRIPDLGVDALPPPMSANAIVQTSGALALLTGLLVFTSSPPAHDSPRRSSSSAAFVHACIRASYLVLVLACAAIALLRPALPIGTTLPAAVNKAVQDAELYASGWAKDAARSKSLIEAVAEYRTRYGMAPPPNFDKWYAYAAAHNSVVIDTFDQIHADLLPFWALAPAEIRAATDHLLQYPDLDMGGLRIRGGHLESSPHVPGTHRWMMDAMERMIEPFARHLPDMDLVFNLGDECRMAVPWADKQQLLARAAESRLRAAKGRDAGSSASYSLDASVWPSDWNMTGETRLSPLFTGNLRRQLYYDWVAPTCPPAPSAAAAPARWWDRSTVCAACQAPHSIATDEGFIMDRGDLSSSAFSDSPSGSDDLCHQPDLAYLDGFLAAPTSATTRDLLPIFSQSRVGGFSDILIPSVWNFEGKTAYDEADDVDWSEKHNDVFWRGSSSDGYASDGAWTGFLRSRLVNEAHHYRGPEDAVLGVNVSFIGDVTKCDSADCADQRDTFDHWGQGSHHSEGEEGDDASVAQRTPFAENWRHRHLVDVDGAGFSGRFIPFLQSRSLVYRSAVFKSWFDERLFSWHHYVPVDVRLGRGFWSLAGYLGGGREVDHQSNAAAKEARDQDDDDLASSGSDIAHKVATSGRAWAARVLRPEDMQVYMFRLLLEWGRLVDDERDTLGFSGA